MAEEDHEDGDKRENKKSKLNFIKGILPYFDSEWSYGRFKVPGDNSNLKCTCAFTQDSSHLIVVTNEGTYFKAQIPKSNGNCKIVETK